MKMKALLLTCVALSATAANAASIEYQMLIDGNSDPVQLLPAGEYTLSVIGQVTDNDLTGGGLHGGFLQASFDLLADSGAVEWKQGTNFLGQPNGKWDSETNAAFAQHNAGVIDGLNVIQETGSVLTGEWDSLFAAVGANQFSPIASGVFMYDGTPAVIDLTSALDVNVVAAIVGANLGGAAPADVSGYSITLGIPEPGTIMLAGLAMIGLVATGRRSY